jgi:hypothetical protein
MWSCPKALPTVKISSIIILGSMNLTGCATSRMMIRYGDLDTKTEMSESVFLELRSDLPQTVYISEASTAGRELTILPALDRQLTASGYTLVDVPGDATYIIQINHLRLVESELQGDQTFSDAIGNAWMAGAGAAFAIHILVHLERPVKSDSRWACWVSYSTPRRNISPIRLPPTCSSRRGSLTVKGTRNSGTTRPES